MSLARTLAAPLLACAAFAAQAVEIEGHSIPESLQLGGRALVLNGAVVRRFAIFKVEVAALYLAERQTTLEGVFSLAGPKRLRLVMLRDVSAEDLRKKFLSDLRSVSAPAELAQLDREIAALGEMFRAVTLREGDVITVDWLPGAGTIVAHNGRSVSPAPLPPELLYRLILRIFVGPDAAREPRERLLGLKPIAN